MELMQISKDNFIDTTNEENIKKYQENLNNIIRDTKEKGFIDKYVIIRNDDFFPNDYEWILNCKCTYGEYQKLVAWRKFNNSSRSLKDFIQKIFKSKVKEEKESVQQEDLYLFYPVHFRSTKHFTVNTPLGLTGEYNGVSSRRTFTIIDDINNFLSSGYGYSLSERDAYLDITHESLKISDKAIILLSIDDYNKLKHDEKMMATLSQRQLIVYKGDSSVTINMLLSEKGILPFRTEFQYDDELKQIISESLKKKCKEYSLYYDHCHGGTPSELHFTSYLDCFDNSSLETLSEFIRFVNASIGEELVVEDAAMLYNYYYRDKWLPYIDKIGLERFKQILNDFNSIQQQNLLQKRQAYLEERNKINEDTSLLFKQVVQLLNQNEEMINLNNESDELTKMILQFYLSFDVESQIDAARGIQNYFDEYFEENKISKIL